MGLNCIDLSIDLSGLDYQACLNTARDRLRSGDARAVDSVTRWFKDPDFADTAFRQLTEIHRFLIQTVQVGSYDRGTRDVNNNAGAYTLRAGDRLDPANNGTVGAGAYAGRHIFIGLNFRNLPKHCTRAGEVIDTTTAQQSRLETLFHELSHAVLGTGDSGYGANAAFALGAALAQNNAENWGMFIEELGERP